MSDAAYVKISRNPIREAINMMELLSKAPDCSEWDMERKKFCGVVPGGYR